LTCNALGRDSFIEIDVFINNERGYRMNKGNYNFLQKMVLAINTHLKQFNVNLSFEEQDYVYSHYANDFIMKVTIKNLTFRFTVNVKKKFAGNAALAFLRDNDTFQQSHGLLYISDYISPEVTKYLIKNNISFINCSGKVFIHQDQLYLYFDYPEQPKKSELFGSAFEPTGIKFVFYLLNNPECLANSFHELAEEVDISVGSISKIIKDLKLNRFVYTLNDKRILRNKNKLLDQWYVAYGRKVRPKISIGKYRLIKSPSKIQLPKGCRWGGEVAAELLNLNLRSQDQIIYTEINPVQVIQKLRLIPDEKGKLELLSTFWNTDMEYECNNCNDSLVPKTLIYADLMLSENDRNIEIAHEILR